uniref:TTF-type domain-containing protein n=1 Tax=Amphimedon queenslandica TaxID=400682 RepID=A0A1X7U2F4_AMPQE
MKIDDKIEFDKPCIGGTSSFTSNSTAAPDIAHGIDEKPVQPYNTTFRIENGRSFNASWFSKHTWLEYSISKDAVYCYACRFFSTGIQRGDECFLLTGYRNWKNATGMGGQSGKHTLSNRDINAVCSSSLE